MNVPGHPGGLTHLRTAIELVLDFFPRVPVALLQPAHQDLTVSLDCGHCVVRQLAPRPADAALELHPVALQRVPARRPAIYGRPDACRAD